MVILVITKKSEVKKKVLKEKGLGPDKGLLESKERTDRHAHRQ